MAPLTLREVLELACESSSDGFRSYPRCLPFDDRRGALPPVRLLIELDLRRSPSRSPSSFFPKSAGALARLTRTLSRRLREGFWRRREDDDDRDSLGLPSPLVSSCSASESEYADESETDLVADDKTAAASASESEKASPSPSSSLNAAGAAGDGHKEAVDGDEPVGMQEDKQQLSPVSVMDFPFDDDDGEEGGDAGTCSPSFQECLADLQRSKTQLLHKIRRLEDMAAAVEPVDLEARLTASEPDETTRAESATTTTTPATPRSDDQQSIGEEAADQHEPDEHRLLERLLKGTGGWGDVADKASERLLLDFFADGVDRLRAVAGPVVGTVRPVDDGVKAALVRAGEEWARGAGPQWGVADVLFAGDAALAEMERPKRWMCVAEEEREAAAEVEALVMDDLVAELVGDFAVARRRQA